MTKISNLHKRWIKNPSYRKAYAELSMEFEITKEVIQARIKSGLSQEALAERMHTSLR
jgi:DNA-binding transcriptional regulator YiaG